MEQQQNSLKGAVIALSIALPVLLVAGIGGTYYAMNQKIEASKEDLSTDTKKSEDSKNQADQNTNSEKKVPNEDSQPTNNNNSSPLKEISGFVKTPVVSFVPDTFAETEKKELLTKIINPFIDFQNMVTDPKNPVVSLMITRYGEKEARDIGYTYAIDVINANGEGGGWLERPLGEQIKAWVPGCYGGCEFTEEYKKKYPDVIKGYESLSNL